MALPGAGAGLIAGATPRPAVFGVRNHVRALCSACRDVRAATVRASGVRMITPCVVRAAAHAKS